MESQKITIIGLGYVGLPLAVEFGKKYPTTGFDINGPRIAALILGHAHAIIVAVAHQQFKELGVEAIHALGKENYVLYT